MTTEVLRLHNIGQKLFFVIASLLGAALLFYFYAVFTMTVAVVDRNHAIAMAHTVASTQGDLEQEYMSLQNNITLARAQELGLTEVAAKFTGASHNNHVALR